MEGLVSDIFETVRRVCLKRDMPDPINDLNL